MRVKIFRTLSLSLLFIIIFSVALVTTGLAQSTNETKVTFPDANLEAAIRGAVDKPEGLIFTSDLDGLTSLKTVGITDLTGLEYCNNLTELVLDYSQINDLTLLASLTNLTKLRLYYNHTQISDISPLVSLTNLTWLDLGGNQIGDISPLASLTKLTELYLGGNQLSDISPLSSLTNLTELGLDWNQLSDISPLASLNNLTNLYLSSNQISDISPLASLTNLTWLDLGGNQINDISSLLLLPSLKTLRILQGNPLSETSLNVYIPQLKKGGVSILREKTSLGTGRGEFFLIPLVAFIAALVVVLLFPPTRGGRRRGLLRSGLIVGVVLTGIYTLFSTFAFTFDVAYLENLLFNVWIPGLALYGITVLVVVISRKKA